MAMDQPERAKRLSEVYRFVEPGESLGWGDPRYVDLASGRGRRDEMTAMRFRLQQFSARDNRFAKVAFTGNRGGGKTSELYRLEHDLAHRFTPLHVFTDDALLADCGFPELFLWMVDELVRMFKAEEIPLDGRLVEDIGRWFFEITVEKADVVISEIIAEAETQAGGKLGFLGIGLSLLARLKSEAKGSTQRREEIRGKVRQRPGDLLQRINLLLDNARHGLEKKGKPADLLIVVDNLDRVTPEVGRKLFRDDGPMLKEPRAHLIYTVPNSVDLAPFNIAKVFPDKFTLVNIKVRERDGKPLMKGIDALVGVVAHRLEIDAIFHRPSDVRTLAEASGGSLRDLMELLKSAQLLALVDGKELIETDQVEEAIHRLEMDYLRALYPRPVMMPLLARVHLTKSELSDGDAFTRLLYTGSILEYNGDELWYDVHPTVQQSPDFQEALSHARREAEPGEELGGQA